MRFLSLFVLVVLSTLGRAQTALTIDEAIKIALKNNYDILVAQNESEIAKINNTAGNAGMLPDIELTGSGNYELNNEHQKLNGGNENNYPSLSTTSVNAGAQLTWTLFDGGKMFVTKSKLNEIEALGEIQFREKVLETVSEVIAAYYDIVRQKQQLNSINEVMKFNQERVTIAETGFNSGSLIKQDMLLAKIDYNITLENAINQQYIIGAAEKRLNQLLGQNPETRVAVSDSFSYSYSPDTTLLVQQIDSLNTSILFSEKQKEIAELSLRENYRLYSPSLDFKAGYYLNRMNNSDGAILENRSIGPQVGAVLSIPIYSSGENKRKVSTAKMDLLSAQYELENMKLNVHADLQNAITNFKNQKQLVELEKENNRMAYENMEISLHRLRLGQTTSLEVHQAQDDYVQSSTRLINFEYNFKLAETHLKQLLALID